MERVIIIKEVSELLRAKKLKLTPQRLAIFNMLYNTDIHPTAETIYKSLAVSHPSMSLATVYKTLDSLKKANLIIELNVGEDSFRYDINCSEHVHFVCSECNGVYDLEEANSICNLKDKVMKETNFIIQKEQVIFYGICSECNMENAKAN